MTSTVDDPELFNGQGDIERECETGEEERVAKLTSEEEECDRWS
jgi:hypothetical protein